MKITWTKCSERMPPNDDTEIIVLSMADHLCHKLTGKFLNQPIPASYATGGDLWCEYTPEAWEELRHG